MPGYESEPSRGALRRHRREKRQTVIWSVVGAVFIVALVVGLIYAVYVHQIK
jgi:predicted nucleic acid-binding Zn ribbon protein